MTREPQVVPEKQKSDYVEAVRECMTTLSLDSGEIGDVLQRLSREFERGQKNGKSVDSIRRSLGAPKEFATAAHAQFLLKLAPRNAKAESAQVARALKALLIVAPINFILASGPLLLIVFLLLAGWALSIGIAAVAAYAVCLQVLSGSARAHEMFTNGVLFFLIGLFGSGLLGGLVMTFFSEVALRLLTRWLGWNFRFLMGADS